MLPKVLVTGAHGMVGAYLCRDILAKQWQLIATGSTASRLPFAGHPLFTYETMELTDPAAIDRICDKHRPDLIIHSAAMSRPDECEGNKEKAHAVNTTATINLLAAAGRSRAFFIFLSTDFIFDGTAAPYTETDRPHPLNYYGQTKWEAEQAVMQYQHGWAIVRTILVYGRPILPRPYLINIVEEKLRKGETYKVVNDQFRTATYVEDLSAAIMAIAEKKAGGVFHVSGKDLRTPYEMALRTAELLNLDTSLLEAVDASVFTQPAIRPRHTAFSLDKARKELGYAPLSFEEGLKKTLNSSSVH